MMGEHHARLYRLTAPEKLKLPAMGESVTGLAFGPDGRRLAMVGKNRTVRVCDAATGRTVWQSNNLLGPGQCVGYSPDGQWLATGDWDTDQVWIWDARTGRRLIALGDNRAGRTWSVQFSPDVRYLAAGSQWNRVKIWRLERDRTSGAAGDVKAVLVNSWPGVGQSLQFSPDNRYVVFESGSGLCSWDFDSTNRPEPLGFESTESVQDESFTPGGYQLLALAGSGEVATLEIPVGKKISSILAEASQSTRGVAWARLMCLSPDGSRLAITSPSKMGVDLWNPKTGKLLYSLPEDYGTVYWLAWSPDNRRLAVARDDGNIAIWSLDAVGQILAKLGLNP